MSDPLSVAAGVAGLLSLGIQVTENLFKFYTSYKDQDSEVARMTQRLENLLLTFRSLEGALEKRQFRDDEQDLIADIESSVQKCGDIIKELQEECGKLDKTAVNVNGIKNAFKVRGRRAAYPFRQSTLQKLEEDINDIRDNLSLALGVLQLKDQSKTQDDITEIRTLVERIMASQVSSAIRDWLDAPDATINQNIMCAKRHLETGLWFINCDQFTTWLAQENSFLWLHGFAGCGKSVLSSTAIQHTFRLKGNKPRAGIAFFYFTFTDTSKRDALNMLRALLLQLSGQSRGCHADIERLREVYPSRTPPINVFIECLHDMIQKFDQVYILLDALDESPRYSQRDEVLNVLDQMRKWSSPGLHLLVTSRDEPDIRESLSPEPDQDVILRNADIDKDISNFISDQLTVDSRLRKWHAYHDRIQQALTERAQGVFRYVECQFDALKRCPRTRHHLDRCLQSLPRSLDETYERMLCSIDEDCVEDARRILTLLCFSTRPLKVEELIHAYAVNLDEQSGLDREGRLLDLDSIHEICLGLIEVVETEFEEYRDNKENQKQVVSVIRIAHFSVQEYLESDRIKQQEAAVFALQSAPAHSQIAHICLLYLLEPELSSDELDIARLEEFPLARFAAQFWHSHYKNASSQTPQVEELARKLFIERTDSFFTWIKLHDPHIGRGSGGMHLDLTPSQIASQIYYASLIGLDRILHFIIAAESANGGNIRELVNSYDGELYTPLQAASFMGHGKVVQTLIDNGADVNASSGGFPKNALGAARVRGHMDVLHLLLANGGDMW